MFRSQEKYGAFPSSGPGMRPTVNGIPTLTKGGLNSEHDSWQQKLFHILHHEYTHFVVLGLLILDILLVIAGIILEIELLSSEIDGCEEMIETCLDNFDQCEDKEFGISYLQELEHICAYTSVSILCLFILEALLLFIASPSGFFEHPLLLLDFIVAVVSLVFELLYIGSPEGGLLVITRCWRFARIGHGVYEYEEKAMGKKASQVFLENFEGDEKALRDAVGKFKLGVNSSLDEKKIQQLSSEIHQSYPMLFHDVMLAVNDVLESK